MKTLAAFTYRKKKAEKLKRKIWRFAAPFLIWLVVTGLILFAGSPAGSADDKTTTVVVKSGDTLWGLAKIHAPGGVDIRRYLDELLEKNGLTSVLIYPGQELILPL